MQSKHDKPSSKIVVPAIEINQGRKQKIYAFAIDGKLLSQIATISRVKRETNT